MLRIAINGFGRIGRNVVRALYQSGYRQHIQVVAINDLTDPAHCAHLLQYDSVHGRFSLSVSLDEHTLLIEQDRIPLLQERNIEQLPWHTHNVDVVLECTGRFTHADQAKAHIQAGAGKVLVSAPTTGADCTVVYGVNEGWLSNQHRIVSNASCTTNCLAPIVKLLHQHYGIEHGSMTTIHAYTNDQHLLDLGHDDLYRARAAALSMIPSKTGAATALGLVLPEMAGKISGMAVRVPTANVSLVDLVVQLQSDTDRDHINRMFQAASAHSTTLTYNELPLVSVDFNGHSASSIVDGSHTQVQGRLAHIMAWYDNEWGFCHRMLDVARLMGALQRHGS